MCSIIKKIICTVNCCLAGRILFHQAPHFCMLLFQYSASLIGDKTFIADVSCRTGLLLTDAFAFSKQQAATGFDAPLALLAKSNKS